jgi:diguanylate cyclase (GGDEF)-like protein
MRLARRLKAAIMRQSLTLQIALLSLIPMVALGFVLANVLQAQNVTRALHDASESARLVARIGIEPRLTPGDLAEGLTPAGIQALDEQLSERSVAADLARIKIWNTHDEVIYSDDHQLIGRSFPAGSDDELQSALGGHPDAAKIVTPSQNDETASEVGLGRLVEVYVPLRFLPTGPPVGAFEIYLSYRPLAASVAAEDRTIELVVAIGLALLWAVLFPIVARASLRLRRQARENYQLARYDPLTGLPNRTLFITLLRRATRQKDARRPGVAVLLVDLEGFREINDTLGHSTGDHVLKEVGRRLSVGLGEEMVLARLGGDEYGVMTEGCAGTADALRSAAAIESCLSEPIAVGGVALNVEASIGVALAGEHADDVDLLLQRADVALSRAKSRHSTVAVYSPEYDRSDAARLKLLGEVRPALERGEFLLHYQPKIDLETRRVVGVEALLRWHHPERGLVPPMEFIPLVEQTALIGPLTLHVIDEALRQLASWRADGLRLKMAVNLSARNLVDHDLPAQLGAALQRHGIPAGELILEVTESAAMTDPDAATGALEVLRGMGVGVSIDDFGTGNASISYLARLPASEIKIDRSFITDIGSDARSEAIVRSTIDLARHLGLSVVAEGIENEQVLMRLAELRCQMGQGFGIARPLPAEELTTWLFGANGVAAGTLQPLDGHARRGHPANGRARNGRAARAGVRGAP